MGLSTEQKREILKAKLGYLGPKMDINTIESPTGIQEMYDYFILGVRKFPTLEKMKDEMIELLDKYGKKIVDICEIEINNVFKISKGITGSVVDYAKRTNTKLTDTNKRKGTFLILEVFSLFCSETDYLLYTLKQKENVRKKMLDCAIERIIMLLHAPSLLVASVIENIITNRYYEYGKLMQITVKSKGNFFENLLNRLRNTFEQNLMYVIEEDKLRCEHDPVFVNAIETACCAGFPFVTAHPTIIVPFLALLQSLCQDNNDFTLLDDSEFTKRRVAMTSKIEKMFADKKTQ